MRTNGLGFTTILVSNVNSLTNPENPVTEFLNSEVVRSVISIQVSNHPQVPATCQVHVLYERRSPNDEDGDVLESRAARSAQTFKKRRKPDPLR